MLSYIFIIYLFKTKINQNAQYDKPVAEWYNGAVVHASTSESEACGFELETFLCGVCRFPRFSEFLVEINAL